MCNTNYINTDYLSKSAFTQRYVKEEIMLVNKLNANGEIKRNSIDGISVSFSQLNQKEVVDYQVHAEEEHLEIFFELNGSKSYEANDRRERGLETLNGRYSFFYYPVIDGTLTFVPQKQQFKAVDIDLTISFINRLFCGDLEIMGHFGKNIINKKDSVFARNETITPRMMLILQELSENELTGILKKAYIESKTIELLLLIIKQQEDNSCDYSLPFLSKEDVEKLYYAREIISDNIENPYSIRELARITGLNEFKLKKGFREKFNTTVFNYLFEIRMNHGKSIILDEDKSIGEVALIVGYKNPAHFTTAFRRYFGFSPSELRKGKIS